MMKENELRPGLNKVELTGVIKENKLSNGKSENGKYINGSLVIKTGEFSEIEIKVFVNELTKKGKENQTYILLKQILEGTYKTMADGVSEEEATKVRVWSNNADFSAGFKEEIFKPQNSTQAVTKISIDLGFGRISIDEKVVPEDYKATFDVEMFINKIQDEEKNNEETGRVIISGYIPVFGGKVVPINVVAGIVKDEDGNDFDFADQIRSSIDEKTSINLWGNIDFKKIIVEKKKGGTLGMAKTEEEREYINDLVAVGGDILSDDKEFDEELITEALSERQIKIQEIESQEDKKTSKRGLGSTLSNKKRKSSATIDPDEIPF